MYDREAITGFFVEGYGALGSLGLRVGFQWRGGLTYLSHGLNP